MSDLVAEFIKGLEEASSAQLTIAVARFTTISERIGAEYDVRNAAWRADQEARKVKTVQDLAPKTLFDRLVGTYGESLGQLTADHVRESLLFRERHNLQVLAGYQESVRAARKVGSWSGYVAWLYDVRKGYVTAEGKESGTRPAPQSRTSTGDAVVEQHVVYPDRDWTEGLNTSAGFNTAVELGKLANDLAVAYAVYLAGLDEATRKSVVETVKTAIANA